jgi:hypothetical protein
VAHVGTAIRQGGNAGQDAYAAPLTVHPQSNAQIRTEGAQMSDVQQVMELIDELGDPKFMSKEDWKEFLECVITECESRLEAVNEELRE